ncbi:MAG: tetratricopeptide repeat protein, partial [Marinilabiliaceae bacterium]
MKKLVLIAIALVTVTSVFSQKRKVNAAQAYIENGDIEAAEKRMENVFDHKRSKDWPKTYVVAAQLDAAKYEEQQDSELLQDAVDDYMKAIELDKEANGRFENEIKVAMTFFLETITNAGIEAFNQQKYEEAMGLFENVLKINDLEMMKEDQEEEVVDTAIIYNTGLAAYNAEKWETAAEYLDEAIKYDYGEGDAVLLLDQVYNTLEDSTKRGDNLKRGFEKYPEDERLLTQLINYYLETGQNDEAKEYLNQAIDGQPENPSFYYARGVLFDQNEEYEKAIDDYKKAIELDDQYFDALYNLGVIYFNQGIEIMGNANEEADHERFQEQKAKADSLFEEALPHMEKAHELEPEEESVLESLKGLYYRFDMNDKYEEVNEKLQKIRGSSSEDDEEDPMQKQEGQGQES